MAKKRMFDIDIINQDSFFDLPMDAKALYFLLGMEADDEGFVSPKRVLRLYGGTEDSLKVLATKKYIIPFKSGVIVITDWKRNNYIDKNKLKPTIYQEEKAQLNYDSETQKYKSLTEVKPKLNQSLTKVNLEEYSIEESSIEESRYIVEQIIDYLNKQTNKHFKNNTQNTKKHINARLNEGYVFDDFKKVIDTKTNEWLNDKKMNQYLRPDTLFGTKFESYLNQQQRDITTKDLAKNMDFSDVL